MKICREGYIGTCTMPNGEIKRTAVYPRCDKRILEMRLWDAKEAGTISSYEVKWEKIWVDIEPGIIVQ